MGNRLQLHRHAPNAWDAWDVDEHYRRNATEIDHVDAMDLDTDDDRAVVFVRAAREVGDSYAVGEALKTHLRSEHGKTADAVYWKFLAGPGREVGPPPTNRASSWRRLPSDQP